MNKPAHPIYVPRIPTLDEVETAGAGEPVSLDRMIVDFARGSNDTRQVGEPWPEGDGNRLREAVQRWLGQEM